MPNNSDLTLGIQMQVEDIDFSKVSPSDVQKDLSQKLSSIKVDATNIFKNAPKVSQMTSTLRKSFDNLASSYTRIMSAQVRFNDTMAKAGASTQQYQDKLEAINADIGKIESLLQYGKIGKKYSLTIDGEWMDKSIDEWREYIDVLKSAKANIDPADFVDNASEAWLSRIAAAYKNLGRNIEGTERSMASFNTELGKDSNKYSEEFNKASKSAQKLLEDMQKLNDKAQILSNTPGTSEHAWENLNAQSEQLVEKFEQLRVKMNQMANSGTAFNYGANRVDIHNLLIDIENLNQKMKQYQAINQQKYSANTSVYTDEYQKKLLDLQKVNAEIDKMVAKSDKMNAGAMKGSWASMAYDAEQLRKKVEQITEELKQMVQNGKAFKVGGDNAAEMDNIAEAARQANESLGNVGPTANQSTQLMQNLFNKIQKFFEKVKNAAKSAVKWLLSVGKTSKKAFSSGHKSTSKFLLTLLKATVGVRSLYYFLRKLRSTLLDGFKEMAKQIPSINTQLSKFLTLLNQFKGNFVSAFQPIVSYVIPVLNKLMGVVNTAMEKLAQFFATLTGQGYYYKYVAKNIDLATDSAKEFKNQLMGFDEINRLTEEDDDSSDDWGSWVKSPLDTANDLAELIRDAWTKADFTEVGEYIGEWLRDALNTATEKIEGPIRDMVLKIANCAATFLNGFTGVEGLAEAIGNFFGAAINVAVEGIDKYVTTVNWNQFGAFLRDSINTLIKKLDIVSIGKTLGDMLSAAINFGLSLVTDLNFAELGQKIGDGINKMFEVLLTEDSNGVTSSAKLGQAITKFVRGIISSLATIIRTVKWDEVGRAIGEAIANIDWEAAIGDLASAAAALIKGLVTALWEIVKQNPFEAALIVGVKLAMSGLKVLIFGNALKLGVQFVSGFKAGTSGFSSALAPISAGFSTLTSKISGIATAVGGVTKLIGGIGTALSGVVLSVGSFVSMWTQGFSAAKEVVMVLGVALAAVGAIILGAPATIVAAIAACVAAVASAVIQIKDNWEVLKEAFVEYYSDLFSRIGTGISNILATIGEFFSNVWSTISTFFSNVWSTVTSFFSKLWSSVTSFGSKLISKVASICSSVFDGIKNGLQSIGDFFSNIGNWISTHIIQPIKNVLGIHSPSTVFIEIGKMCMQGLIDGIKSMQGVIETVMTAIGNFITLIFNTLAQSIFGPWRDAINEVTLAWETWQTSLSTGMTNITTIFTTTWPLIITTFQTQWDNLILYFTTSWTTMQESLTTNMATMTETYTTTWTNITTFLTTTWETITITVTTGMTNMSTLITTTMSSIVSAWNSYWSSIQSFTSTTMSAIMSIISSSMNNCVAVWSSCLNQLYSVTANIFSRTVSFIASCCSQIRSYCSSIVSAANSMASGVESAAARAIAALNRLNSARAAVGGGSVMRVPHLASGAVIPPNKEFMAVLGDQKSGTNIEAPLETIQQAVALVMDEQLDALAAMAEAIVKAIEAQNLEVSIGDAVIGKAANRYNRRQNLVKGTA